MCVCVCYRVINTHVVINTSFGVLQSSEEQYRTGWSEENRRSSREESNSTGSEVRPVCVCGLQKPTMMFIVRLCVWNSMSSNQLGDVGMVVLAQALKVNHVLHTLRYNTLPYHLILS